MKAKLIDKPDYSFSLELTRHGLFLHSEFYGKWSKKAREEYLKDIDKLVAVYGKLLVAHDREEQGMKQEKLLKMAKFTFKSDLTTDGRYGLWIRQGV